MDTPSSFGPNERSFGFLDPSMIDSMDFSIHAPNSLGPNELNGQDVKPLDKAAATAKPCPPGKSLKDSFPHGYADIVR